MIINDLENSRRKIISTEHGGRYGTPSLISPTKIHPSKKTDCSGEAAAFAGFSPPVRFDGPSAHVMIPSIIAVKRSFEILSDRRSLGEMQSGSSDRKLLTREAIAPPILHRKVPLLPLPPAHDGHSYIPFENLQAHASSIIHIFGVRWDLQKRESLVDYAEY